MTSKNGEKEEKEECKKETENETIGGDWDTWTDPLETLSEIEDCFELDGNGKLHGKTILDVGTDCVKPLYIALKYEPDKIVGINEDFFNYPFEPALKQKSGFFTKTEIQFYECSLFEDERLKILGIYRKKKRFHFVLLSKTLHHLRSGKQCVADKRDKNHQCLDSQKHCINEFKAKEIFDRLFRLGKRVIVYECFSPQEEDDDKVRGRGGTFTIKEWRQIFTYLLKNYTIRFIRPTKYRPESKNLEKELEKIEAKLREVDCICFYAEKIEHDLE